MRHRDTDCLSGQRTTYNSVTRYALRFCVSVPNSPYVLFQYRWERLVFYIGYVCRLAFGGVVLPKFLANPVRIRVTSSYRVLMSFCLIKNSMGRVVPIEK